MTKHRYLIAISLFVLWGCEADYDKISSPFIVETYNRNPLFQIGNHLKYQQNFDDAIEAYQKSLKEGPFSFRDSFYLFNQVAYCYLMMDQEDNAKEWLDQIDVWYEKDRTFSSYESGIYAYNKGRKAYLEADWKQAMAYGRQSLEAFESQEEFRNHLRLGQVYTLLGLLHFENFEPDSTMKMSQKAGLFFGQDVLKNYSWENDFLHACASIDTRAHENGQHYCLSALDLAKKLPFPNPLFKARCHTLLGNLRKKEVDNDGILNGTIKDSLYQEIDQEHFAMAIKLIENSPSFRTQEIYSHRLVNAARLKDTTLFQRIFSELLSVMENGERQFAYPDQLKGYFFNKIDIGVKKLYLDSVIYYYSKFLGAFEGDSTVYPFLFDEAYYLLMRAHQEKGEFEQAIKYGQKGLAFYDCCPADCVVKEPSFLAALNKEKNPCLNYSSFLAEILTQQYEAEKGTSYPDDLELAGQIFGEVRDNFYPSILNSNEDAILALQNEAGKSHFAAGLHTAHLRWEENGRKQYIAQAFAYMEKAKSYLLFRDKATLNDVESTNKLLDTIRQLESEKNRLLFRSNEEANSRQLSEIISSLEGFEQQRNRNRSIFDSLIMQPAPNIEEIRTILGNPKGVVQYLVHGDKAWGLYLDRREVRFFEIENVSVLKTVAKALQEDLWAGTFPSTQKRDFTTFAGKLFEQLIQPFADRLPEIEHLLVIRDDFLDWMPFEILLDPSSVKKPLDFRKLPYLITKVEVSYTPAWRIYASNHEDISAKLETNRLGIYSSSDFEEKIAALYTVFEEHKIEFEELAGKESFLEKGKVFDLIHVMLHARSNPENRLENYILFGEEEEDYLFGFELPLLEYKAQLIVLAACETAFGKSKTGEGTYSLTRSLIKAGVPQVISTLWRVKEDQTAELLELFYQFLFNGQTVSKALRSAKIEYLKGTENKLHTYPAYWSGVILNH